MTHRVTEESRKFVENAAAMGLPHEQIAVLVGVKSDKTLRKKYRKQLDEGKAKANLQMATAMWGRALKGDATLMIWWSKTQMKWKEDRTLELSTPEGRPLGIEHTAEPELLGAYYERQARIAAERRAHPRPHQDLERNGQPPEELEGGEDALES